MIISKNIKEHIKDLTEIRKKILNHHETLSLNRTSSSNTLRNGGYKKNSLMIDLSHLNQILSIDSVNNTLLVEPRITFSSLCKTTIEYGYIPPVVPEFKSITLGGAIMGAAIESSSHCFGQVSDNCLEYECILGNGDLILASPDENADLFYGMSASYGTLALLTLVKMKLIKAKKYVHLKYHHHDLKKGLSFLNEKKKSDFIEAIGFSKDHLVVIEGNMEDKIFTPFFKQRSWSSWYPERLISPLKTSETMLLFDYLFRWDLGAFWMGMYVASFNSILRMLTGYKVETIKLLKKNPSSFFKLMFGWAFSSKKLYKTWHRVPNSVSEHLFFIHDFYAPISTSYDVLNHFLEKTEIYPFWLCPVAAAKTDQFLSPHYGKENFLNIGLYGVPFEKKAIMQLSKELEKKIVTWGGRKMLYSFTYYDFDTFSKIYDLNKYENLRKKFHAQRFPHLFHKVTNQSDYKKASHG